MKFDYDENATDGCPVVMKFEGSVRRYSISEAEDILKNLQDVLELEMLYP